MKQKSLKFYIVTTIVFYFFSSQGYSAARMEVLHKRPEAITEYPAPNTSMDQDIENALPDTFNHLEEKDEEGQKIYRSSIDWDEEGQKINGFSIDWDEKGQKIYGSSIDWDEEGQKIYGFSIDWDEKGQKIYGSSIDWDEEGQKIYGFSILNREEGKPQILINTGNGLLGGVRILSFKEIKSLLPRIYLERNKSGSEMETTNGDNTDEDEVMDAHIPEKRRYEVNIDTMNEKWWNDYLRGLEQEDQVTLIDDITTQLKELNVADGQNTLWVKDVDIKERAHGPAGGTLVDKKPEIGCEFNFFPIMKMAFKKY